MCVRVCACVRACVCVCVSVCVDRQGSDGRSSSSELSDWLILFSEGETDSSYVG